MSKTTSFAVGPHFEDFIKSQVSKGRYGSASEVLRAGLRLLEERESKHDAIRKALIEGLESGISDRTVEEIWDEAEQQARERNG